MSYITKYLYSRRLTNKDVLLVNTLSSAIDLIDNDTEKKLQNMIQGKEEITEQNDPDLYIALKKRGYLFDNGEQENNCIKNLFYINENFSLSKLNTSFTICPTMGCNLRCIYCFESGDQHKDMQLLTEEQLEAIFNHILQQSSTFKELYDKAENKEALITYAPKINLFGGEPLLKTNYEIVRKIFEFADKMKIPVKIITNGTTIDYYYELLDKHKHNLSMQITLDGDQAVHDTRRVNAGGGPTFERICNNVDLVLKLGISIALRINIDKENIKQIKNLETVFINKKWKDNPLILPYAAPVQDFQGSSNCVLKESELLQLLYEYGYYGKEDALFKNIVSSAIGFVKAFFEAPDNKVKPWKMSYCEATSGSTYCFAPDGTITTCLTYVGKGKHYIGTFDKDGVHIIPENYDMWTNRYASRIEKCKDCKFVFMCGGGCPVAALEQHSVIDCAICSDIERTLDIYINNNKEKFLDF